MENKSPIAYVWKKHIIKTSLWGGGGGVGGVEIGKTDCSLGHQHAQNKQLNIQINLISQNRYYKHLQNHALSKLSKKKLRMSQMNKMCFTSLDPCQATLESETGILKPFTEQ